MNSYNYGNVRRKIIINHYLHPLNKGQIKNVISIKEHSNTCMDSLTLFIKFKNNIIYNAKFEGKGCAIFISSTDIMISQIIGKTINELKDIIKNYDLLLANKTFKSNLLGSLVIYKNIKKHPNRLVCARMIILAIKKAF